MKFARLLLPMTALFAFYACTPADEKVEKEIEEDIIEALEGVPFDAQDTYPLTETVFSNWFKDGSITKDGIVTAANSMDFTNTNNVDFYKWSYRMFLWITSEESDGTRVFDSKTFYDVAPADAKGNRALIPHEPGVFRNFSPRLLQTRNVDAILDETEQGQAGGGDVLMTQNGSLVYYTLMVNDVMAVFRTKTFGTTPNEFPSTSGELDVLVEYGKLLGVTIDDPKALAMELKLSWVESSSLSNPEDYVQIKASIPQYTKNADNTTWTSTGETKTTMLSLTGMHVVGNAKGHPEMLWATFEHGTNTPQEEYSYITNTSATKTVPFSTSGDFLFCADGAVSPFNVAHMKMDGSNIQAETGFKITASNSTLVNSWGAAVGVTPNPLVTSDAESNSEVISLNSSVIGMLIDGDVRKNYMLIGCTWTDEGGYPYSAMKSVDGGMVNYPRTGLPSVEGLGDAVGTSRLANSTMETYHQADNCFNCHNNFTSVNTVAANIAGGGYTDLSHIFSNLEELKAAVRQK
jgi:hypothetical protein